MENNGYDRSMISKGKKMSKISIKSSLILTFLCLFLFSCSRVPNKSPESIIGKPFPILKGKSLSQKKWTLPNDLKGQNTILLTGYVQGAQFDIDRWLIGLSMAKVKTPVFEVPAVKGFFIGLFKERLDQSMRNGIPSEIWKAVVTVYGDSEKLINFTGSQKPRNSRVFVLDKKGEVIYFHDRGFSVNNLERLLKVLPAKDYGACFK